VFSTESIQFSAESIQYFLNQFHLEPFPKVVTFHVICE
jgi:hypothetical protein